MMDYCMESPKTAARRMGTEPAKAKTAWKNVYANRRNERVLQRKVRKRRKCLTIINIPWNININMYLLT